MEVAKSKPKNLVDPVWLELGEEEVCGRPSHLECCLVGWWG